MIDALITGRLAADPKSGTSSNNSEYATARILVKTNAEESLSVSVIAFDRSVVAALLAAGKGDSVALSGEFTPKVWTDQQGVSKPSGDLKAHAMLTPYNVTRRRKAAARTVDDSDGRGGDA